MLVNKFPYCFDQSSKPNLIELKKTTYYFFDLFFNSLGEKQTVETVVLSLNEQVKIEKIEHFLISNLCGKFPGIEILSKKFKISPTKLKQNFKIIYGMPVFQYFQTKQMTLAFKYINDDSLMIKEISRIFGYENASKFAKTFQKYHNILPSEVNN